MVVEGTLGRILCEERFGKTFTEFQTWRLSGIQSQVGANKGKVLPFIRGLRLSANLIYIIRELLEGSHLTANWGHIVDDTETFCSRECDVIIHYRDGIKGRWNGSEDPVMNFRFISSEKVVVVVSCKSMITKSNIDTEYCQQLQGFADRVWLFAECCGPRSINSIGEKAKSVGYEQFWPLYTLSKNTQPNKNLTAWYEFEKEVNALKD